MLSVIGCYELTERIRGRPEVPESPLPTTTVDRQVHARLGGKSARSEASLSITSSFRISRASGGVLTEAHEPISDAVVRAGKDGGIELGCERLEAVDVVLTPRRDASIVVNDQTYRGELRIQCAGGEVVLVNHLEIEAYLRGVLRGELSGHFHPEAFKAQAVAARTFVLWEKQMAPAGRSWDVLDNEGSQMYIGVRGEDAVAVRAVEQTRGQVCVHDDGGADRIFCTFYSSTCGGLSQSVKNIRPNQQEVPPLRGNVVCRDCAMAPHFHWGPVKISKTDLTKRLAARYPSLTTLGTIVDLKPKATTTDGRIVRMELDGSTGLVETLVGEDFRLAIGGRTLKSTNFEIENKGDRFIFKNGVGYGHGVGLCQWGMQTKALQGWNYQRILSAYYPGSKIKTLY
jgi:stage II sporulation protein D